MAIREPGRHHVFVLPSTLDQPVRAEYISELVVQHHRVLVLGAQWTHDCVRTVLEAGASGCIVESLDANGLAAAMSAVRAGHIVISPELVPMYLRAIGNEELSAPPAPGPGARELMDKLTDRETEILGLLAEGLATKEIAKRLYVSAATVKSHVSHAMAKLGVRNRVQAALLARDLGVIESSGARTRTGAVPPPEPGSPRSR